MEETVSDLAFSGEIGLFRANWSPALEPSKLSVVLCVDGSDFSSRLATAVQIIHGSQLLSPDAEPNDWRAEIDARSSEEFPLTIRAPIGRKLISVLARVRSAGVICVLEDPASLASNLEHNHPKLRLAAQIRRSAIATSRALKLLNRIKTPVMFLSVAKARTFPEVAAAEISTFLNASASPAALKTAAQFIDDRGPRQPRALASIVELKAYLNRQQQPGKVRGWAKRSLSDERIHIQVLRGGQVVAEGIADRTREDLVASKIGDGRHGFDISLSDVLSDELERFEIAAPHSGTTIGYVDMSRSKASIADWNTQSRALTDE